MPETTGSALYGMVDVLSVAGQAWQGMVRAEEPHALFRTHVVSPTRKPFRCANGIPVTPEASLEEAPEAAILIVPEIWVGPDEDLTDRYPRVVRWIRARYERGAMLYSACSGSILLAETGLLDGCEATSHWGYQDLFRTRYPKVLFTPKPSLVFADPEGRIVTAGGITSWHDLAIHIISRHASPEEALRMAKMCLLKLHEDGQLPYAKLVRNAPHGDSVVRACQRWLGEHFAEANAVARAVELAKIPERTLKRRFRAATGTTLIEHLQNLRVEHGKHLLETTELPVEEVSAAAGYEDASFFRRVFRRCTGLSPGKYRRMFKPVSLASRC